MHSYNVYLIFYFFILFHRRRSRSRSRSRSRNRSNERSSKSKNKSRSPNSGTHHSHLGRLKKFFSGIKRKFQKLRFEGGGDKEEEAINGELVSHNTQQVTDMTGDVKAMTVCRDVY